VDELVLDVGPDPRWVPVLVDDGTDVDVWALDVAVEALRIRGHEPPPPLLLEQSTAVLAGIARTVQASAADAPVVGAWSLMPGPEVYPEALALLRPLFPEGTASRRTVVDDLVALPEERYGDPDVEDMETPSGPATRLVQRLLAPGEEPGSTAVEEMLAYVWWLEESRTALVLSTYFLDLVEGGRWRPDCDDLARMVRATVE
jgi:hypothetical protein